MNPTVLRLVSQTLEFDGVIWPRATRVCEGRFFPAITCLNSEFFVVHAFFSGLFACACSTPQWKRE